MVYEMGDSVEKYICLRRSECKTCRCSGRAAEIAPTIGGFQRSGPHSSNFSRGTLGGLGTKVLNGSSQ